MHRVQCNSKQHFIDLMTGLTVFTSTFSDAKMHSEKELGNWE